VETNEQRKKAVRAAIQEELEGFFAQVQDLKEGDLEHLEEQVVKTSQQMGCRLLEGILDSRLREQRPVARRQGRWVQPLLVVDNSDVPPSRLTSHCDSPYDKETIPASPFKQRGFV
jgi:hypothetical protein